MNTTVLQTFVVRIAVLLLTPLAALHAAEPLLVEKLE